MTKDAYESLTPTERLIYDEFAGFAKRVAERQEETIAILKKILEEANA